MDTPEDLLAGRQRLAIFTEPVPEEAFLPYVDCGALLSVQAAFIERPADLANLPYTLYARADAVDPLLAVVAAKCELHRGTPVGDAERRVLAAGLGIDYAELERFLALPPILHRQASHLPRAERLEKIDRIYDAMMEHRRRRGMKPPAVDPSCEMSPAEIAAAERVELDRMLAGTKPVSMFSDWAPETAFQPYVDRGAILRLDIARGQSAVGTFNIPYTYYVMPGEMAHLRRLVLLERQVFRGERRFDADYHRVVGRALGYSEPEIDRYIADAPARHQRMRNDILERLGLDINDPAARRRLCDLELGPHPKE